MTNLIVNRWTPSALRREPFYRLFDTLFGGEANGEELTSQTWAPPVNIEETDAEYRVEAELPGLTKNDVHITLENNVLRLTGERKLDKDVRRDNFHRIERTYGSFSRSFALPQRVNGEKVQAAFTNGVLAITVPKAEQARPRKIEIGS